jgi:hypothetical protein
MPVPSPEINIGASQNQRCHPSKEKDMLKIDLPKERFPDWQEAMLNTGLFASSWIFA